MDSEFGFLLAMAAVPPGDLAAMAAAAAPAPTASAASIDPDLIPKNEVQVWAQSLWYGRKGISYFSFQGSTGATPRVRHERARGQVETCR